MSILVTAAEAGSLSAAARRLGIPLTTVSRKVSDLEAYLKTTLLNRSSRRLTLTDAGRSYVADCKRILEQVGEAERAATGEYSAPKGDLIITAPIVFGRLHVLPVVMAFLKAYPDVDVRIVFADGIVNLLEDHIDAAVRIGELPDSSLVATRVGAIRRVVCGSRAYFAARGTPKSPSELATHDCVTFEGFTRDLLSIQPRPLLTQPLRESGSRVSSPTRSLMRCGPAHLRWHLRNLSLRLGPSVLFIQVSGSCP